MLNEDGIHRVTKAKETLAVSSTAVGFTAATVGDREIAECIVEGGTGIRLWTSGDDPTASDGMPFADGDPFLITGNGDILACRMIRITTDAKVFVQFS